jgi:hypothetical protein
LIQIAQEGSLGENEEALQSIHFTNILRKFHPQPSQPAKFQLVASSEDLNCWTCIMLVRQTTDFKSAASVKYMLAQHTCCSIQAAQLSGLHDDVRFRRRKLTSVKNNEWEVLPRTSRCLPSLRKSSAATNPESSSFASTGPITGIMRAAFDLQGRLCSTPALYRRTIRLSLKKRIDVV